MADIAQTTKKGIVTSATSGRFAQQYAGDNTAGVDMLVPGTPIEIQPGGANGKAYPCASGVFAGITAEPKRAGQPVTTMGIGTVFHASDAGALVVGNLYYVSATAGRIADAATAKDAQGAFYAVTPYDLQIIRVGKLV
jgi:paraquat-inducible protein B